MDCSRKNECSNFKTKCHQCNSMADMMHPYPEYVDKKEHECRLARLLNDVPALVNKAAHSPYDTKRLAVYLVNNGVRVEE